MDQFGHDQCHIRYSQQWSDWRLATNNWGSSVHVTYAQLESALASHEFSPYAVAAVDALPSTDPNPAGGADWSLPTAYAWMLGLTNNTPPVDDTVTLNIGYDFSYGQDVINTIEHELSEGAMGRIGGLGDQNSAWSTMDLFRYSSPNVRDYTDGRDGLTTYSPTTASTCPRHFRSTTGTTVAASR